MQKYANVSIVHADGIVNCLNESCDMFLFYYVNIRLHVNQSTVIRRLHAMGKILKEEKWFPHERYPRTLSQPSEPFTVQ